MALGALIMRQKMEATIWAAAVALGLPVWMGWVG